MDVASVTLDEVLRAARARSASLVPETAGYLALAIGDASARLPYRVEDALVTLTTEGTVRVARGRENVPPEEGARVLRDHLHRLLSVSAGSMPGLAQAAHPRTESAGPEAVIAEIESALIPVNRAAARRSLARLARDTAKARDAGRLAPTAPAAARSATKPPAPAPTRPEIAVPAAPAAFVPPAAHAPHAAYGSAPTYASYPVYAHDAQAHAGAQGGYATYAAAAPHYASSTTQQPAAAHDHAQAQTHVAPEPQPPWAGDAACYATPQRPVYVAPPDLPYLTLSAEAYAPPASQTPTRHAPPVMAAPAPGPFRPSPSYAEIPIPAASYDVEIDIDELASEPPNADEMTHRMEVGAGRPVARADEASDDPQLLEAHDATTIDAVEVIEATFARIEAELLREAEATPRMGTTRQSTLEGELGAHLASAMASPAPAAVALATRVQEATRALEEALESGRLATPKPIRIEPQLRMRRLPWQADLGRARKSDVVDLLARFGASEQRDATAMRRDIKRTIGIDATQLPPRVAVRDR